MNICVLFRVQSTLDLQRRTSQVAAKLGTAQQLIILPPRRVPPGRDCLINTLMISSSDTTRALET
jgi:hypothetical protein